MKDKYNIVVLPGDGIGPEVIKQALEIFSVVTDVLKQNFELISIACGGKYYLENGKEWPDGAFEKCKAADAILLGAVGYSIDGNPVMTKSGFPYEKPQLAGYSVVIGNRTKLDLYANIRPVKLLPGIRPKISGKLRKIWNYKDVDYIIVRENTEDAYINESTRLINKTFSNIQISRNATERIVRFAFNLALRRKLKVTCVDKSNIIEPHLYFREIFTEIGRTEYPSIKLDYAYFDSFSLMQLQHPENYDIVVCPNLVGDVISEIATILQGGIGMAASANIGERHAMFEPIHGSAQNLMNKDLANPTGAILATAMLFDWLGQKYSSKQLNQIAFYIEKSIIETIKDGILTIDLAPEYSYNSCSSVGERIKDNFYFLLKKEFNI